MQVKLTGEVHDYYEFKDGLIDPDDLREGDILIQSKLDKVGRMAVEGGHANWGYSGYYSGFLYADGAPRRFLKWVELWPGAENTFQAQQDKRATVEKMRKTITKLAGSTVTKVKGGWQLEQNADETLIRTPAT